MARRILYLSHAPQSVYDIIRGEMPRDCELVTLSADDDRERMAKIADAEIVIVAAHPLTARLIDAAKRLRLVHHQGVGYQDTVDHKRLAEQGIGLALTPAGTTIGVAEHTVLLILAALKRLPFADSELRQGRWHINALRPVSREINRLTIGYIGMGRIGQAVAERLVAFGCKGLYFDPAVRLPPERESGLGLHATTLNEVLGASDVVTLHIPATARTRHIIDAAALARMRQGSYLINTARGALVDEGALYQALSAGHLAGAALDVFETEPPVASPLLKLENVVLTPHIAAGTRDALAEKMRAVAANIVRFYRGEPLEDQVLPPTLPAAA